MATDRARRRPAGPAPASGDADGASDLATSVWRFFAEPTHLLWLLAGTLTGGFVAAVVTAPDARADLLARAARSPLVERLYAFLDLHDPVGSWWMALLVGASALSIVAAAVEHAGGLAFLLSGRRSAAKARPVEGAPVEAARRAAARLGPQGRVGVGEGFATASSVSGLLRIGVALLIVGAALGVAALWLERSGGLAGELVLAPGDTVDRLQVPGGLEGPARQPLGFSLKVTNVAADALSATVRVEGRELRLGPPITVQGVRLAPRAARATAGGERFALRVDPDQGEPLQVTVGLDDPFAAPGGRARLRAVEYAPDFRGLGPAVRIERTAPGTDPELFWVFERHPDFDARNRPGDPAVVLEEVRQRRELIVGAVRHPGLLPGIASVGLLLLGLALAFAGARSSKVVVVSDGLATGSPAADAGVKAALTEASRGSAA